MQFRRHDTFYIRKGWINKGIKNLKKHDDLFSNKELYPTDLLGIGANMVKALRYWLQAIDLTEETSIKGKIHQVLTDFGRSDTNGIYPQTDLQGSAAGALRQ